MVKEKFSLKLMGFLAGLNGFTAYAVILSILLACGLGVPVPEDITLIAAGILAGLGNISLAGAMVTGTIGVLIGDAILFFLGRIYGERVFRLPGFRRIFTEKRINKARARVLANSKLICFFARFLAGLRAPIYLTAGMLGVRPLTFLILDGLAALISVPVWIYVGYFLGDNIDMAFEFAEKMQGYILLALALIVIGFLLFSWRLSKIRAAKKMSEDSQVDFSIAPSKSDLE